MRLIDVARDLDRLRSPTTLSDLGVVCGARGIQGHLVVLRQPYLGRILAGAKTIESRFSKYPTPPFKCVANGDVLVLKKSGGAILAVVEVVRTHFHGPLTSEELLTIADRKRQQLQLDDSFLHSIQDSRYATLVYLGAVVRVKPCRVEKSDLRGWVVLKANGPAVVRKPQIELPLD